MSHKVVVTFTVNTEKEVLTVDRLLNKIKNCAGIYKKYFEKELKNLENELISAKEKLLSLNDTEFKGDEEFINKTRFEYQRTISNIIKRISNLESSINYGDVYKKYSDESASDVNKIIVESGIEAILAIEELQNEGAALTKNNLLSRIKENSHKAMAINEFEKVKGELEKRFITSTLDKNIKRGLMHFFRRGLSHHEMGDLSAMIETKIEEFSQMKEMSSDIEKALNYIGFELKSQEYSISSDGTIELDIVAYKDGTKDISMKLFSDRRLTWQFGNYENHMCDYDGEIFRNEALGKFGIKTSSFQITRNVSNSRRILKAAKIRERKI